MVGSPALISALRRRKPEWTASVGVAVVVAAQLASGPAPAAAQQREACDERASLQLTVTDESGMIPLPGATVVLLWTDGVSRPLREAVGADGRLHLCVPTDGRQATIWAELGDNSSEQAVVELDPGTSRGVELRVLFGTVEPGRVIGRVLDAETDRPLSATAVSLVGRGTEVETDRQGRFALSGILAGEQHLEIRRIGYARLLLPLSVASGLTTELEIALPPEPLEMEPLVATVIRPRRLEIVGFYERKFWGELVSGGTFFTAEDIDRRRPLRISHMIADAPGIRLRCSGSGINSCRLVNPRFSEGFSPGGCTMNTYVDGVLIRGGVVDEFVLPLEVAGVEIYQGPAQLPGEFAGSDARCGAVVVWTK